MTDRDVSSVSLNSYRRVGEGHRFRECVGLGFDDLVEGTVVEHRPGRTITEYDNVLICAITGNDAPIHTDAHYARQTPWGKPLVCSAVTLGVVAGMTVRSMSGLTLANLALDNVTFKTPVYAGDTLYAESVVLGRRLSSTYPDRGIVTIQSRGVNADEQTVVSFTRVFFVPVDATSARQTFNY